MITWPEDSGGKFWTIWKGRVVEVALRDLACTVETDNGDKFCVSPSQIYRDLHELADATTGPEPSTDESVDGSG